jgi:DNA-directed RNA polymerase specialized sigma24 family protein
VAALPRDDLSRLIQFIQDGDDAAWAEFVQRFSPLLLQAARTVERDRDAAADAFVFIFERLRERRGARLASYDSTRPGSFETWLRAVALNLARDARRRRVGRFREWAATARLPPLEQRVFRLRYEQGFSFDQTLASLVPEFPGLTESHLAEADARVTRTVTSQQRWSLITRRPQVLSLSDPGDSEHQPSVDPATDEPDPEGVALLRESRDRLVSALATLDAEDRLLVRLHFERGATLATLAAMFGLSNPQAMHRRLRGILERLRRILGERP